MKISINIPTNWNQLNQWQLEQLVSLFQKKLPAVVQQVKVLEILMQIKKFHFIKKIKLRYMLTQIPLSELSKNYAYLYTEVTRTVFEKVIKVKGKIYHAPQDRLANLTAEELSVAMVLQYAYRKTKKIEYLQTLFHLLYTTTENRPEFDRHKLQKEINPKIPLQTLLATELVFFGCMHHLANKYKKVFPKPGKVENPKPPDFDTVLRNMAKGDLSKLKSIEQTNMYKFLDQFQEDIVEFRKQKLKK